MTQVPERPDDTRNTIRFGRWDAYREGRQPNGMLLETRAFPASLYYPGILVPRSEVVQNVNDAYPRLYARIMEMQGSDPEMTTGFIRSGVYSMHGTFDSQKVHAERQFRAISWVLRNLRQSGVFVSSVAQLPAGEEAHANISVYEEPLFHLERVFGRAVREWSPISPSIPFSYWAACSFPYLHVAANVPISSPGNHASMWALTKAYKKYAWK